MKNYTMILYDLYNELAIIKYGHTDTALEKRRRSSKMVIPGRKRLAWQVT